MATFADEAGVRLRFQLNDTALAPSALIGRCLGDAHDEVLRRIAGKHAVAPVPDGVVLGETLLGGAYVLRGLASKDAQEQKQISIGDHQIDAGKRFASLMALAELSERAATQALADFLPDTLIRTPGTVTDTVAVLGEV